MLRQQARPAARAAPPAGQASVAPRVPGSWAPSWLHWLLAFQLIFALAAGAIALATLWRASGLLTGQALQLIAAEARGLNEQYRAGGLPLLVQAVSERSKLPGNGLYLLTDGTGARLAGNLEEVPPEIRTDPSGGLFRYERRRSHGASAQPANSRSPSERPSTERRVAVGLPIRVGGSASTAPNPQSSSPDAVLSDVLLIVGRDIEETRAFAQATWTLLLAAIGALSLLSLGGAMLYGRALARRVDAVTAASQRIMAGDLTQRLPVGNPGDEIGRLSGSVNVMLGRIEELLTGLREVSDNIAHDLKTPLTRLRNRAEAALRDPRGEPAAREGLEHTLEEADGLIKTFNALLSIARLEAGAHGQGLQVIDLAALVADTLELYEPVAEEAGLRIARVAVAEPHKSEPDGAKAVTGPSQRGPAVTVTADRQLLGQALANLIENAMNYGCDRGAGGADASHHRQHGPADLGPDIVADIEVGVGVVAGLAQIIVADHGPGIRAADRERVLKRFVRLETSRTRPGTGLGLSLVAAVARVHGGSVRLEDNRPGLRVVLSLPLAHTG